MKFHVFLTPMHLVEIDCDAHDQVSGVHRFSKADRVIAEFANCIGWLEVQSGGNGQKASVTQLTVVSSNVPPAQPPATG